MCRVRSLTANGTVIFRCERQLKVFSAKQKEKGVISFEIAPFS
jgi:hypothetical protein